MTDIDKVRINSLRRKASRLNMKLVKSGRRDPDAPDYDRMWLENEAGKVVFGGKAGATADEVEAHLYKRPS